MTPTTLRQWREALGMDRSAAPRALGISRNTYQWYEEGKRKIPRTVALACAAVWCRLPAIEDLMPRDVTPPAP